MSISAKDIQSLRASTGAGMMDCKKALEETNGDVEAAKQWLREKGLAALIAVPSELYDAAEVDGASVWNKVWHVTMPHLRGVLFITLILQIIGTAQVFLEPFLFTNGGPNHATETIMLRVYNLAFANLGNNFGEATALSLMLAAFLAVLSLVYFRVTRSWSTS